jgi:pSer/pThr/pTyr-binding forkhead associated (FHA) protein
VAFGYLILVTGAGAGAIFQLGEAATIGRGDLASLRIAEASVSSVHARVERTGPGMWQIVDAGSANGTLVNGEPIAARILAPGDIVMLGRAQLLFRSVPRQAD